MNKINNLIKYDKRYIVIISSLLSLTLIMVVFAIFGLFPFGGNAIVYGDALPQYFSFLNEFREMIITQDFGSIFNNMSMINGTEMFSTYSYYLMSPFNLLVVLFEADTIPFAFTMIIVIKMVFCSAGMSYYLKNKNYHNYIIYIGSIIYAISGYTVMFMSNYMWLDVVMVFPLMVLGIEKLVNEGKYKIYLFSLVYAMITNYYIAFMICIFSFIYFAIYMLMYVKKENVLKRIVLYVIASIGAGCLCAVTLIPNVIGLMNSKLDTNTNIPIGEFYFNIIEFTHKMFLGAYDVHELRAYGLPNLYVTLIIVILGILYFVNKRFNIKDKFLYGSLLLILFLSMYIVRIDTIWHGFSKPVWFNFRYSFMFIFILIIIACEYLNSIKKISKNEKIIAISSVLIISICNLLRQARYTNVIFITIEIIVVLIILFMFSNKYNRYIKSILVMGLISFNFGYFIHDIALKPNDAFSVYYNEKDKILDVAREHDDYNDDDIIFTISPITSSEGFLLQYSGFDFTSSTIPTTNRYLLSNFGYSITYNQAVGDTGSTVAVDALFGAKYYLAFNEFKNVTLVNECENDVCLYMNENRLNPVFSANNYSTDVNYTRYLYFDEYFKNITGKEYGNIYNEIDYHFEATNLDIKGNYITVPTDNEDLSYMTIEFTAIDNNDVYFDFNTHFDGPEAQLIVNDKFCSEIAGSKNDNVKYIGTFEKGEEVELLIYFNGDINLLDMKIFSEDMDIATKYLDELDSELTNFVETNTNVSGDIVVNEGDEGFIVTMPYDEGWSLKLDGEDTEFTSVDDGFIFVNADVGKHSFEFTYTPKGMKQGFIVTISTILIYVVYQLRKKFIKKKV